MTRKHLTLMVIPHNESRVREFHISRPALWVIYSVLGLSLFALVYYTIGYYVRRDLQNQYASLNAENGALKQQLDRVGDSLDNLRFEIDDLSDKDRMMRAWVNLSEPGEEIRQVGVGGGFETEAGWDPTLEMDISEDLSESFTSLDQLTREAEFLQTSFDSILATLSRNDDVRRHTPSIWPIRGEGWISSRFGYRTDPFTGEKQRHLALDIAGRSGTPILATADGVVENASYHRRMGHYITIKQGVYRTIYCHLKKGSPLKVGGSTVKRGEKIAEMGSSGRSTATHLHYSVVQQNRAVDPEKFIWDKDLTRARGRHRSLFSSSASTE